MVGAADPSASALSTGVARKPEKWTTSQSAVDGPIQTQRPWRVVMTLDEERSHPEVGFKFVHLVVVGSTGHALRSVEHQR